MTTSVVLLGTGNPNPDPRRSGPSVAVIVDDDAYIVDAGPGIVRRAAAAFEKGVEALRPAKLRFLFLTHLHSDHTLGLPDIMLTPWVMERNAPLSIYAAKAGKDVYSEKPVTLTIEQGKVLRDVMKRYGRIYQSGTQGRSDPPARRAAIHGR